MPTMTGSTFTLGDVVDTPAGQGTIIDLRATPSGRWVFGVESTGGTVNHFTEQALSHARKPEGSDGGPGGDA